MKQISQAITKFCYKHPRFGIPRQPVILVAVTAVVYALSLMDTTGTLFSFLYFDPNAILHGQLWRLVSWMFLSFDENILFVALALYFTFVIGTSMESVWGSGKLTIYYLANIVAQVVVAFLMYFFFRNNFVVLLSLLTLSASYINLSLFFAYATVFPDHQITLFFILPLKAKWLAWGMAAVYGFNAVRYIINGMWAMAVPIAVTTAVFLLIVGIRRSSDTGHAHGSIRQFREAVQKSRQESMFSSYLHKCVICGKTDVTDPKMDFRYCTRCEGYKCYCADHINNHKHVEK